MANGFQQRYKGRLAIGQVWLGVPPNATKIAASGADLNVSAGWATVDVAGAAGTTIRNSGVTQLTSTALGIWYIAAPSPGVEKVLQVTSASSGWGIQVPAGVTIQGVASTGGAGGGSSLTNTIKSTVSLVATQVELIGVSTLAYLFAGVYPATLSHLLFSTAT